MNAAQNPHPLEHSPRVPSTRGSRWFHFTLLSILFATASWSICFAMLKTEHFLAVFAGVVFVLPFSLGIVTGSIAPKARPAMGELILLVMGTTFVPASILAMWALGDVWTGIGIGLVMFGWGGIAALAGNSVAQFLKR
jgi:hypothetical protein